MYAIHKKLFLSVIPILLRYLSTEIVLFTLRERTNNGNKKIRTLLYNTPSRLTAFLVIYANSFHLFLRTSALREHFHSVIDLLIHLQGSAVVQ